MNTCVHASIQWGIIHLEDSQGNGVAQVVCANLIKTHSTVIFHCEILLLGEILFKHIKHLQSDKGIYDEFVCLIPKVENGWFCTSSINHRRSTFYSSPSMEVVCDLFQVFAPLWASVSQVKQQITFLFPRELQDLIH